VWVKMRRTRIEHMSAGLPPIMDIARRGWHGRKVLTAVIGRELLNQLVAATPAVRGTGVTEYLLRITPP
jgi:hypothetical protein